MAKIDRYKKQYPELDVSLLDIIATVDPSQTKKYLDFLIKQIRRNYCHINDPKILLLEYLANAILGVDNVELITSFEDHYNNNRIRIKDISLYETMDDIKVQVAEANEIVRIKELEKQTTKLYDSKEWLVVVPNSHESSQIYANGTKWCVTMKSYWNDYRKHSRIVYIINKTTDEKYAISKRFQTNNSHLIQGWDAKDNEVSPFMWEFTDEIWKVLRNDLKKTRLQHELDEIESGYIRVNTKGDIVKLEKSTLSELEWFYKKYHGDLTEPFLTQVVERGKKLREEEALKKLNEPKPTKTQSKKQADLDDLSKLVKEIGGLEKSWEVMENSGYGSNIDLLSSYIREYYYDSETKKRWK